MVDNEPGVGVHGFTSLEMEATDTVGTDIIVKEVYGGDWYSRNQDDCPSEAINNRWNYERKLFNWALYHMSQQSTNVILNILMLTLPP